MTPIVPLNLPKTKLSITKTSDKLLVNCLIRKKRVVLSPEEWVRQHLIALFVDSLSYPKGLISVEKQIKYGSLDKRWDLAVFKNNQDCFLLVECKAPNIEISKAVLEQSLVYYKKLQADYLLMSNGINHIILKKNPSDLSFEQINSFPEY
jgi:hypothetical protein